MDYFYKFIKSKALYNVIYTGNYETKEFCIFGFMENGSADFDKIYNYWYNTSDTDYSTMINLYTSKDYHWALFIGHIVLEKLLKAAIVIKTKSHAPYTHDLRRLSKLSGLIFERQHLEWLDTITTFNLNTRYDTYKQEFYKKCTPEFTLVW